MNTILSILETILSLLGMVKGLPNIAEEVIAFIEPAEQAVAQAIAAHKAAQLKVDPATLQPENPV